MAGVGFNPPADMVQEAEEGGGKRIGLMSCEGGRALRIELDRFLLDEA